MTAMINFALKRGQDEARAITLYFRNGGLPSDYMFDIRLRPMRGGPVILSLPDEAVRKDDLRSQILFTFPASKTRWLDGPAYWFEATATNKTGDTEAIAQGIVSIEGSTVAA